jgi:sec-independent protein translocase protein TatC
MTTLEPEPPHKGNDTPLPPPPLLGGATEGVEMTITEHLEELRSRLIKLAYILLGGFAACYFFSEQIFNFLRDPILPYLPATDRSLHFTGVFEKFVAHVKVSFIAGVILTSPLWMYQVWGFIAPGLYAREKKYALSFIVSGVGLFVAGAAFAYKLVFPMAFKFLLGFAGEADKPMITIKEYVDFVFKSFLAFGLAFEMPVVLTFLGIMGVIDSKFLSTHRRWAILIMAIVSAVVTPPDALSMLALLLPMVGLYELSIILVRALRH